MSYEEPAPSTRRKRRFMADDIAAMFAAIAVILSALALYFARLDNESPPAPEVTAGDQITVERAEAILSRAEDVSNTAGNILSFLETGSAIVGVILVVGAFMLRRSILDQVETAQELGRHTEERFRERDQAFAHREDRLAQLAESQNRRLDEINRDMQERIAAIQDQVRNSFRVVSLQLLAEQQTRERNTQTAIDTLQRVHDLDPDNQATNYLLGYLYMSRKDLDRAIEHLEHALEVDPEFTPAIAAMGLALRRKGDALDSQKDTAGRDHYWQQAKARLQQALNKDPRLTDAEGESYHGTLGGLFRRQGHYYAAIDAYEQAHKVTPKSSYPIINLATLHTHLGNHDQARTYFEQVVKAALLQLDDDPRNVWARVDYAQALLVLGKTDQAFEELQTMIDQNPEWVVLSTVLSGLKFLAESPKPIEGLDRMVALLEEEIARRDGAKSQ